MADIESRVDKLETRVTSLEQQVSNISTKLDMFIDESREARKRQDEDIRELRQKQNTDMNEIRQSIEGMGKHVRNMSIVTIIGIAAMVIAVLLK